MNVLLMTDGDRPGAFLLDASGRIVASVADNEIPQPAPRKFCAHGSDLFGWCKSCARVGGLAASPVPRVKDV